MMTDNISLERLMLGEVSRECPILISIVLIKNTLVQSSFGGKDLFGSQLQITVGIEGSQGRNMKAALLATPLNINPNQKNYCQVYGGIFKQKKKFIFKQHKCQTRRISKLKKKQKEKQNIYIKL